MKKTILMAMALVCVSSAAVAAVPLEGVPVSLGFKIDGRISLNNFDWDSRVEDETNTSDIHMRYADLRVYIEPNEHVEGFLLFRYEGKFVHVKKTKTHLDEGWLKLKHRGAYFKIGRVEMPISYIETLAVEKPYSWWMADLVKPGAEVGFENDWCHLAYSFFNGGFDTAHSSGKARDDQIDDFAMRGHIGLLGGLEGQTLLLGGGYVSDIAETEFDFGADYFLPGAAYRRPVSARNAYFLYEGESGDYKLAALGVFMESGRFPRDVYADARGDKTRIGCQNYELALYGGAGWIGAKYHKWDGFDWLFAGQTDPALTPTRFESYGAFGGIELTEYTSAAFQVMHGHDDEGNELLEAYLQFLLKV